MARKNDLSTVFAFMSKPVPEPQESSEVDLFAIRPDPSQPRKLLPPDLAQAFEAGFMCPQEVSHAWQSREPDARYTELARLADSIAQHGLINPISVRLACAEEVPEGVEYLIVTGERRWWSHVLLYTTGREICEGAIGRPAELIKVNLTHEGVSIRAHQLIENLVREDLNVVEKALGMRALRTELSEVGQEATWKTVEQSLGISKQYRIYVTNVLELAAEARQLIQAHNLSERMVRPIVRKLRSHPELQMKALNQLLVWLQADGSEPTSLVKGITQYVTQLTSPSSTPNKEPDSLNKVNHGLPRTRREHQRGAGPVNPDLSPVDGLDSGQQPPNKRPDSFRVHGLPDSYGTYEQSDDEHKRAPNSFDEVNHGLPNTSCQGPLQHDSHLMSREEDFFEGDLQAKLSEKTTPLLKFIRQLEQAERKQIASQILKVVKEIQSCL